MKRVNKFLLAIFIFTFIVLLTGCTNKRPISPTSFKSIMEGKQFVITDATNQFSDYSFVKTVYVAQEKGYNYQIEYFEFATDNNAKAAFSENKSNFIEFAGNIAKQRIETNTRNYQKFQVISNGKYMTTIRIKNTVLFVNASEKYTKEIKAIINELGY